MLERRSFLSGILALGVAPAIVRVGSLMPVKVPRIEIVPWESSLFGGGWGAGIWERKLLTAEQIKTRYVRLNLDRLIYGVAIADAAGNRVDPAEFYLDTTLT